MKIFISKRKYGWDTAELKLLGTEEIANFRYRLSGDVTTGYCLSLSDDHPHTWQWKFAFRLLYCLCSIFLNSFTVSLFYTTSAAVYVDNQQLMLLLLFADLPKSLFFDWILPRRTGNWTSTTLRNLLSKRRQWSLCLHT